MRSETLAAIVITLAACGGGSDGPDIAGTYMTTYHTLSERAADAADCAGEGPAATTPPFFRIFKDPQFGLTYQECDTADSCTDTLVDFVEPMDNGWHSTWGGASYSGGLCTVYHWEYTATVIGDGALRVEVKEWTGTPDGLSEDDCLSYNDDSLKNDPTACDKHEVIEGHLAGV